MNEDTAAALHPVNKSKERILFAAGSHWLFHIFLSKILSSYD
jgi:hypothetical protein